MTTTQEALLTELEPVVEANLNRHLEKAKPWNPHDYVPWSRGRDFALLGGQDWTPADSQLDEVSKAAMCRVRERQCGAGGFALSGRR